MSDYIDQEFDLRPFIEAIINNWYWILGLGLLAGVLAYVATGLLVTPSYEATALVSITEPRQRVQFDPRIVTVEENQPLRAYPEIAISDELLATLQSELPDIGVTNVQQLRAMLKAAPGSDPSLLRLTAQNPNPETAAVVANEWAELFVSWANRAYGDAGEDQLIFFEQRLEDAEADLKEAEGALVNYQAQNRFAILENELLALQQTQADLLAKQGEISLLSQDIDSLLALSQNSGDAVATDQFTTSLLKLRAFGGVPGRISTEEVKTIPWQLQVTMDTLAAVDGSDQEDQIRSLQQALEYQVEQTEEALAELEPKILAVQKEKQEAEAMESLTLRNVELAEDTLTALARTVEEKRITSQDTNAGVRLASRSAVPASPTGSRKTLTAAAAAVGVVFLSIFVILLSSWWRS